MRRIALINGFHNEYTTAGYFRDAIEKSGMQCSVFKPENQKAIGRDAGARLFIDDGTHYVIRPDSRCLKILYIIDTHMDFELDTFLIRFADHVFCAQRNAVEKIAPYCPNVTWLPLACDPAYHYCSRPSNAVDLSFIGGINDGKREKYLGILKERYGPRTFVGLAPKSEIGKIYSGSKIVFNVSINNDINMRFFEALCSGALLVTERISANGMEQLLGGHKEPVCVFYESIEEAIVLIDYYLNHEQERAAIAERGRRFSLDHTYSHRLRKILETAENSEIRRHPPLAYSRAQRQLALAQQRKNESGGR